MGKSHGSRERRMNESQPSGGWDWETSLFPFFVCLCRTPLRVCVWGSHGIHVGVRASVSPNWFVFCFHWGFWESGVRLRWSSLQNGDFNLFLSARRQVLKKRAVRVRGTAQHGICNHFTWEAVYGSREDQESRIQVLGFRCCSVMENVLGMLKV